MPFNPAPSQWIPNLRFVENDDLGSLPMTAIPLLAEDGSVWELSINPDGTLQQTLVQPAPQSTQQTEENP